MPRVAAMCRAGSQRLTCIKALKGITALESRCPPRPLSVGGCPRSESRRGKGSERNPRGGPEKGAGVPAAVQGRQAEGSGSGWQAAPGITQCAGLERRSPKRENSRTSVRGRGQGESPPPPMRSQPRIPHPRKREAGEPPHRRAARTQGPDRTAAHAHSRAPARDDDAGAMESSSCFENRRSQARWQDRGGGRGASVGRTRARSPGD